MHHAAQHLVGGNGALDHALGVDGLQPGVAGSRRLAVQKPPGHTVHRGQHHGVGADHRAELCRHLAQGWGFERHQQQVLHAQIAGFVAGVHWGLQVLPGDAQLHAVGVDGLQALATRQHTEGDRGMGLLRQARTQPAATGAGANQTDLHA